MPKNQQSNYQNFINWFCGKATLKRRIPRSLHQQSNIFKGSTLPTTSSKTYHRLPQKQSKETNSNSAHVYTASPIAKPMSPPIPRPMTTLIK